MYKSFASFKTTCTYAAFSLALAFSASAMAGKPEGPGKPGQNEIAEGGTIVDIALAVNDEGAGEFNGLLEAVGCFGPLDDNPVVDLLSGSDKYTLFAPVDSAFADLYTRLSVTDPCDPAQLDQDTLFAVLTYHVTDGRRFSNSVFNARNAKEIEMLNGGTVVSFINEDGDPTLHDVDGQMVGVVPGLININAVNGVIHVIDTVLLPIDLP